MLVAIFTPSSRINHVHHEREIKVFVLPSFSLRPSRNRVSLCIAESVITRTDSRSRFKIVVNIVMDTRIVVVRESNVSRRHQWGLSIQTHVLTKIQYIYRFFPPPNPPKPIILSIPSCAR